MSSGDKQIEHVHRPSLADVTRAALRGFAAISAPLLTLSGPTHLPDNAHHSGAWHGLARNFALNHRERNVAAYRERGRARVLSSANES
jgi:hypothetical protein